MRHQARRHRLNQKPDHARVLKRNLVTSLLLYESIRTTKNRARVIQPMVDRLITIAKKNEPHNAIRAINAVVTDRNASRKIMEVLKERYAGRSSGFTTLKPAGARKGDGAALVTLSLMDIPAPVAPTPAPNIVKKPVAKKDAASSSSESSASPDSSAA